MRPAFSAAIVAMCSASQLAAQSPAMSVSRFNSPAGSTTTQDTTGRRPLPEGFLTSQIAAGAKTGFKAAGIGFLSGAGIAFVIGQTNDDNRDLEDVALLFVPLAGAALGYVVGAPIGVHRFSARNGVRAPGIAAATGAFVGVFGALAGGIPALLTVPLGAAIAHNAARR